MISFVYQQYVKILVAEEDKSAFKLLIDEKKRVRKKFREFLHIYIELYFTMTTAKKKKN